VNFHVNKEIEKMLKNFKNNSIKLKKVEFLTRNKKNNEQ